MTPAEIEAARSVNIVDVIGSRLKLERCGREFRSRCPFHDEKTASFYVVPAKHFFHCFGCGAHGNVIGFLMQYDGLDFPNAVAALIGKGPVAPVDPEVLRRRRLERRVSEYRREIIGAYVARNPGIGSEELEFLQALSNERLVQMAGRP